MGLLSSPSIMQHHLFGLPSMHPHLLLLLLPPPLPLLSALHRRAFLPHGLIGFTRTAFPTVHASQGSKALTVASQGAASTKAEDAVNLGLELFSKGRVRDALLQFDTALAMNPEPEEAKAALYNKACCHAYREEWVKASQALRQALRDYNLKFSVILNDPDMVPFRAMPEFKQLQDEATKGGQDIGEGFRRDLKLIGEVQAPFRGVRKFLYVALTAAAGISTLFTIPQFFQAVQVGGNAPNLWGAAQNMAINVVGIATFVFLFIWDTKKEEEQIARTSRYETLSRLPLRLSTDRVVEVVQLRDTMRPVILAGKKEAVTRAVQHAENYLNDLLKRGVLLIPLVFNDKKEQPVRKRGFGSLRQDDFEKRVQDVVTRSVIQADKHYKAEVVSPGQWERWVQEQQEAEGVKAGEDVYIVLRLDGRVRKSGVGMPDWQKLIEETPPLDSLISKLER
eukprot:c5679_g1_i1 orf=430-1782(-)